MKTVFLLLLFYVSVICYGQQTKVVQDKQLTKTEVASLVQNIIDLIESNYVDIPAGKKVIDALNEKIESGEYYRLTTESAFAMVVTDDMRKISNDLHLSVRPTQSTLNNSVKKISTEKGEGDKKDVSDSFFSNLKRPEEGFFMGSVLEGSVGLVEFTTLLPPLDIPDVKEDLVNALNAVKNTDHIIFDARKTRGGVPETVAFLSSNLYGKEKVLLSTYVNRITGNDELYTVPDQAIFYGTNKTFYILISGGTGSGAEAFAYMNQQHGSATVVGEVSAGAGRLSAVYPISETLSVMIPENESIHPVSNGGFEKVGVQPDVKVDQQLALNTAYIMALEEMLNENPGNEELSLAIKNLKASTVSLEKSIQKSNDLSISFPIAGSYEGKRKVWLDEEGNLLYQRGGSMVLNLIKIEGNIYELKMSSTPPQGMMVRELPNVRFVSDNNQNVTGIIFEFSDGRKDGPYQKISNLN